MAYDHAIVSNVGRIRTRNEDLAAADAKRGVFLLADGMGGHPDGNLAAQIAIDTALHYLTAPSIAGRPRDRGEKLVVAIREANQAILARADTSEGKPGMGTTMCCVWLSKRYVHVAHVGDSRVYRIRDGKAEQLTHDHTVVQALVDRGELESDAPEVAQLGHILTQAVGLESVIRPDVTRHPTKSGDVFLMCSDGLSDLVADESLASEVIAAGTDLKDAADRLVNCALEAGGHDNVTVLLVRVGEGRATRTASGVAPAVEPVAAPIEPTPGEPVVAPVHDPGEPVS